MENLRDTTVLASEMFTSVLRSWLKNVTCFFNNSDDPQQAYWRLVRVKAIELAQLHLLVPTCNTVRSILFLQVC